MNKAARRLGLAVGGLAAAAAVVLPATTASAVIPGPGRLHLVGTYGYVTVYDWHYSVQGASYETATLYPGEWSPAGFDVDAVEAPMGTNLYASGYCVKRSAEVLPGAWTVSVGATC